MGVLYINNVDKLGQEEISTYITEFTKRAKEGASLDYTALFLSSLKNNLLLALCLWFAGLTVIGVFVVYAVVGIRGFTLGFSISSIIATLGTKSR